jgi:uncharacterized protein (DUF58 family)
MPTRRTFVLIILATGLYFIANQTQVGWVYIMVNAIIGLLLVAFLYSIGMLKSIEGRRSFQNLSTRLSGRSLSSANPNGDDPGLLHLPDFHEDDPVAVSLQIINSKLRPAFLVTGQETCPFAPPGEQNQPLFASSLFKNQTAHFDYQTTCYRRGLYTFSKIPLRSSGPFSLFSTRRTITVPTEILIYPAFHPLKRIRLLENRGFADRRVMRVGAGNEVIGTREYRSGDSLRQIHWRSTARLGKFVVKEFSDDDQLTMTVVLDLSKQGSVGQGKFSTFETAVRLAASLGHYATHKKIPFRLVGHSGRWRPPNMALSWSGTLNYLAKVKNDGQESLANVLRNLPAQPFVVVLISHPDEATIKALDTLCNKGTQTLAIFITLDGTTPVSALGLHRAGLEMKTVTQYNWTTVLDEL